MKSIVRMRLGFVLALALVVGTIMIPVLAPTTAFAQDPAAEKTPTSPVQIPEPLTVVLFGTGLAALSAAMAARR